eukprot:IDg10788t1
MRATRNRVAALVVRGGQLRSRTFKDLEDVLSLEVIDDALSGNVELFRLHPLNFNLASAALSHIMLEIVVYAKEKYLLKALLNVSAIVGNIFSKELGDSCQKLLIRLANNTSIKKPHGCVSPGWICLHSLESLRYIFPSSEGPQLLSQLVHAYDLAPWTYSLWVELWVPCTRFCGFMSLYVSLGIAAMCASSDEDMDAVRMLTASNVSVQIVLNGAVIEKSIPFLFRNPLRSEETPILLEQTLMGVASSRILTVPNRSVGRLRFNAAFKSVSTVVSITPLLSIGKVVNPRRKRPMADGYQVVSHYFSLSSFSPGLL